MVRFDSSRSCSTRPACWWTGEHQTRLSDLPRYLPPLPDGRRVSIASVYRWTTAGLRGVRLRRFRIGGVWCTTTEELARWSAALTAAAEAIA